MTEISELVSHGVSPLQASQMVLDAWLDRYSRLPAILEAVESLQTTDIESDRRLVLGLSHIAIGHLWVLQVGLVFMTEAEAKEVGNLFHYIDQLMKEWAGRRKPTQISHTTLVNLIQQQALSLSEAVKAANPHLEVRGYIGASI